MAVVMKSPGGFFLISFPEKTPGDKILYFILDNSIGGIVLFANHCRDIDSLSSWLADLKKSTDPGFIVAVDQEGGRVCRFGPGFPKLEAPKKDDVTDALAITLCAYWKQKTLFI